MTEKYDTLPLSYAFQKNCQKQQHVDCHSNFCRSITKQLRLSAYNLSVLTPDSKEKTEIYSHLRVNGDMFLAFWKLQLKSTWMIHRNILDYQCTMWFVPNRHEVVLVLQLLCVLRGKALRGRNWVYFVSTHSEIKVLEELFACPLYEIP